MQSKLGRDEVIALCADERCCVVAVGDGGGRKMSSEKNGPEVKLSRVSAKPKRFEEEEAL